MIVVSQNGKAGTSRRMEEYSNEIFNFSHLKIKYD